MHYFLTLKKIILWCFQLRKYIDFERTNLQALTNKQTLTQCCDISDEQLSSPLSSLCSDATPQDTDDSLICKLWNDF